jgi:catechol-2,3-dioxygenase
MKTARVPEPLPPAVRPSRFSHLVLKTARWEEMVAWYKTVLNAQPMFENELVSFLTFDEEHHRVMIGKAPGASPRDPAAAGVVHYAFMFETFEQLLSAYARLRDLGITPKVCLNHGFTTSIYYADPDGNEVELAVDNFDSFDAMNAWFATGAFDRNFVGVIFDPEDLLKRQREGEALGPFMQESYE